MNRIEEIVIVGGGTAGWMSATYLATLLKGHVGITLVESDQIGTVGVGEASIASIRYFFDFIGLSESEWMPECDATYKLAIKYKGWGPSGRHFYHPFEMGRGVGGVDLAEWWLSTTKKTQLPYDYSCFVTPYVCDRRRSPKCADGSGCDDHGLDNYAYHFDAGLLAKLLKRYGIQRGVRHVVGEVSDVHIGEGGDIGYIQTEQGHTLSADLFIDCTGFRGLLINETLGEPFVSYSSALLCDRAVATRVSPDESDVEINPYTTATTLRSGWVWDIPLYSRIGTGYVYSSHFVASDEAEREFVEHLAKGSIQTEPFHIEMRVGRNRNSWVKNCIAIGLSSGFVEPLESSGIFFVQFALEELVRHFPDKRFTLPVMKSYNRAIAECFDSVRDFLILHYCLASRADTDFWKAARYELQIPEDLQESLSMWRCQLPNLRSVNRAGPFPVLSYLAILLGLGYHPEDSAPLLRYADAQLADDTFSAILRRANCLTSSLSSHRECLDMLHSERMPDGDRQVGRR